MSSLIYNRQILQCLYSQHTHIIELLLYANVKRWYNILGRLNLTTLCFFVIGASSSEAYANRSLVLHNYTRNRGEGSLSLSKFKTTTSVTANMY